MRQEVHCGLLAIECRAASSAARSEIHSCRRVRARKAVGGRPVVLHCGGRPRADCPAVLGARGRAQNSPSHGRHPAAQAACARCSNRLRSTPRLAAMRNPRAPALLGAAEAHARPPAHGFAKNHGAPIETLHGSRRGAGGRQAQRLLRRRAAQTRGRRALARASSSDSSRLFERSERSERSEFRDATAGRAAQGSRRFAATATAKRSLPPARTSARSHRPCEAAQTARTTSAPASRIPCRSER